MQSHQTVDRTFRDELTLYKMAETNCKKDLNWRRKLDANLGIFHASVNSDS
jgi:hypothetical protein